jgi:small subunit ribosomal protein S16
MTMKALFANGPVPGVQPEKKIVWNTERIKWWLANGAQPSETVVKLLEKVGRPTVFSHR